MGRESRRTTPASGRLPSRNQQCGTVFTYNRADLAAEKKKYYRPVQLSEKDYLPSPSKRNKITVPYRRQKNIYRLVPPRGKMFTVPSRRRKKYLQSRLADGKNIYLPVPPKKKTIPVPSRRRKTSLPSRSVVKICPVEFYRPVPSRFVFIFCVVSPRPVPPTFYVFLLPSRCHLFPRQTRKICPVC